MSKDEKTQLTDKERARILQRYRGMTHRGTRISFEPLGPAVEATTPEELEQATNQALGDAVQDQEEN